MRRVQRSRRCRQCESCLKEDCGRCESCLDMSKFGGTSRRRRACVNRNCTNVTSPFRGFCVCASLNTNTNTTDDWILCLKCEQYFHKTCIKDMSGLSNLNENEWECFSCVLGMKNSMGKKKKKRRLSAVPAVKKILPNRRTRGLISYVELDEDVEEDEDEEDEEEEEEMSMNTKTTTTSEVYCICGKPDREGVFYIGCEGKCERWFHPSCVGLDEMDCRRRPPQGWRCADCTSRSRSKKKRKLCVLSRKLDRQDEYVKSALATEISTVKDAENPETCVQESWMMMKRDHALCHVCAQDNTLGKIVRCNSCRVVVCIKRVGA
jgi:hypothetical protein